MQHIDRMGQQTLGQALIETGESNFFHQLHQFADALGEQVKDKITKGGLFDQQPMELDHRQDTQRQLSFCHAPSVVRRLTEQAGR